MTLEHSAIFLRWKTVNGSSSYEVEIISESKSDDSKVEVGSDPVSPIYHASYDFSSDDATIPIGNLRPGMKYILKIYSIDEEGKKSFPVKREFVKGIFGFMFIFIFSEVKLVSSTNLI